MDSHEARIEDAGERIRQDASDWAHQAAAQGKGLFNEQKRLAADQVTGLANALHSTAVRLKEERQESASHYADWAASGLARTASFLRDNDLGDLIGNAEGYARRHPVAFMGGAVAMGFLLSRFLKSSASRDYPREGYAGESYMGRGEGVASRAAPMPGPDYESTERAGTGI